MARPSSCACPQSADKRRSNGTGAREAGSNGRGGGQAIRALCAQSGSCTPLATGGSAVLKPSRPRAVSSTPSRQRCSPGGAEPLTLALKLADHGFGLLNVGHVCLVLSLPVVRGIEAPPPSRSVSNYRFDATVPGLCCSLRSMPASAVVHESSVFQFLKPQASRETSSHAQASRRRRQAPVRVAELPHARSAQPAPMTQQPESARSRARPSTAPPQPAGHRSFVARKAAGPR
jgi:hypothetical protein